MLKRFRIGLKALRQLGLAQVGLYALYQLGLRTGHYRRSLPSPLSLSALRRPLGGPTLRRPLGGPTLRRPLGGPTLRRPLGGLTLRRPYEGRERPGEGIPSPSSFLDHLYPLAQADHAPLLAQADEICAGRVRLFGGSPVALELEPPGPLAHWTEYELGRARTDGQADIKFIWEPARFSWAFTLGHAYAISGKEDYAQSFWRYTETFLQANPPYQGPNWTSGQEVALRLMAFIYANRTFSSSSHSTPQRIQLLSEAIAAHARRIPLTLVYARSQNNNHLLSEAAGLYSAGLVLADHPLAPGWRSQGWSWFNRALQSQIAADGTYVQHSANYHRLMLQLALWGAALNELPGGLPFPPATIQRLSAAARWLSALVDPETGQVPNLGANDGAYIMPLTPAPFSDFRPVAGAAMKQWTVDSGQLAVSGQQSAIPNPKSQIRCFLRTARFTSRPSHADQLHLDLWWHGLNVALDAGTYLYNAPPPWENALASTAVHNTVMVDGQEQMARAGRFLWLDWAQAQMVTRENDSRGQIRHWVARHDGYRRLRVIHQRSLDIAAGDDRVMVVDELLPASPADTDRVHTARLHWLLPDWPWTLQGNCLSLASPHGEVRLEITGAGSLSLARAGELLAGPGPITPVTGWYSPTYSQKVPALALVAVLTSQMPLTLTSHWQFPPSGA